ncbi:hypothetical protein V2J09_013972 [Rumex salicifolius]
MCETNPELTETHSHSVDFYVATSLSKYCAYLAAFAPKLLPGHPSITERTCSTITDPSTRWKVVADVWVERILYLAPNLNNEWAHLDCLAEGGPEFITYLWVLLFHVGIVDRDSLRLHSWDIIMEASAHTTHLYHVGNGVSAYYMHHLCVELFT